MFPSPSRGSYFSIHRRTPDGKTINVSVPFPGILFLNKRSNILMAVPPSCFRPLPGDLISQFPPTAKRCATCFVFPSPSRGSYFSITYDEFKVLQVCYEFPSPSRGSYFSIDDGLDYADEMHGFRPLPGDLISQLIGVVCIISWCTCTVSVPFPGILFLNVSPAVHQPDPYQSRFRPLPGDLISQSCPLHA